MKNKPYLVIITFLICLEIIYFCYYSISKKKLMKKGLSAFNEIIKGKRIFARILMLFDIYILAFAFLMNIITVDVMGLEIETDISTRIENLSHNLADASAEILSIQKDLESRIEYVENLKKEAEIAESVISLSEEQINAIQAALNKELTTSNNKTLLQSFLMSAFFFILGLIIPYLINYIKSKKEK